MSMKNKAYLINPFHLGQLFGLPFQRSLRLLVGGNFKHRVNNIAQTGLRLDVVWIA